MNSKLVRCDAGAIVCTNRLTFVVQQKLREGSNVFPPRTYNGRFVLPICEGLKFCSNKIRVPQTGK